ncbi:helix-turn-helix transcriptional regulator [Pseudoteredinibacter isoporae]|uniref:DNA-binding NarL/FixJ family response regulator n=1 Tax=Pseudoteredinibacter isoporae TaxID=570281 RepID=A0A7X0JQP0_9GAMM|nr:LuxR C-terminal-related transcriptional regulator [Pseudoteredinibacter isoporae]MBB6519878.1 DNA-binding NarL/FixJ family response regulator [Pseudoteredinibacter isoporae]NHO85456.1 response regulator transcription factor [Pseudoteredinibacter isoporae]NIB26092.1 response regulator transcription factor [Pseudoteredinibacter isoporae]
MGLSQRQWQDTLGLIEYFSASEDPSQLRRDCGEALLRLLKADHFASYIWQVEEDEFHSPCQLNLDDRNLARYQDYYQFHDPITHKMRRFQQAVSVNQVIHQADLIKTEFYQDFLSRDGMHYGVNLYVFDESGRNLADFRLWRNKQRRNFEDSDLEMLNIIAPHFRNSMRRLNKKNGQQLIKKYDLTQREFEVLRLLNQAYGDQKIAQELYISLSTCRTHIRRIYQKLDIHQRAKLLDFLKPYQF